jgi:ABC-2 type transport system ATP-binding protein
MALPAWPSARQAVYLLLLRGEKSLRLVVYSVAPEGEDDEGRKMIEIKHLVKRFDALVAVSDISFTVAPGEVLGFLGPNGAGKSTTMKVLTGFLKPSSGQVTVFGADIERDTIAAQRQMGYLPEGAPCYDEMTPRSFLHFIAAARGLKGQFRDQRFHEVVATMSLQGVLDQRIESLSKGFKRRVGLAQAIIHDPRVLVLDEPTDGLDPNQKHQVREMIRGLAKDKIVIISTHILEEVTAVCTRAMIIARGKIVADCEPQALEQRSKFHGALTLAFAERANAAEFVGALAGLEHVALVEQVVGKNQLTVFPRHKEQSILLDVSHLVRERQMPVASIVQEKGRLDEVFREVTEEVSL